MDNASKNTGGKDLPPSPFPLKTDAALPPANSLPLRLKSGEEQPAPSLESAVEKLEAMVENAENAIGSILGELEEKIQTLKEIARSGEAQLRHPEIEALSGGFERVEGLEVEVGKMERLDEDGEGTVWGRLKVGMGLLARRLFGGRRGNEAGKK